MRSLLAAGLLSATALLAGCGPDCDAYCRKLVECAAAGMGGNPDPAECLAACNAVGKDQPRTIGCVVSHTCTDIFLGGHCSLTGRP